MPIDNPTLTHAEAWQVLEQARSALLADGRGAAVAVTDAHGELMAFARTDGCPPASIVNAVNKAFTAARERAESGAVGEASRQEGFPLTNFGDLRYTGWGGGIPIEVGGAVVGAVGVSGLPEGDDIAIARTAAGVLG